MGIFMSDDFRLVPEYDHSGNETGYYTREPDGTSGMTISALAEFCSTAQPAVITSLLNRIEEADPVLNDLPDCLKQFAGKDLRLVSNDPQGRRIVPDEACSAITEYYAFEARSYKGQQVAIDNYRAAAKAGIRVFIWSKTGYIPPMLRRNFKSYTSTYIERLENIRDHKVPSDLWTTFREGAEVLLLVEKELCVPVDQMDLCDGSIGKCWSAFREGKDWTKQSGTYSHIFRDQRGPRECRAYSLAELPHFRIWLQTVYIPEFLPKYLVTKFGKLATRDIYQAVGDLNPCVLEATAINRISLKEQEKYENFLKLKQRLLKIEAESLTEQLSLTSDE